MTSGHPLDDFKPLQWLSEGWSSLRDKAHNALTRFRGSPDGQPEESDTHSWGLLASDMIDRGDRITVRLEIPGLNKDQIHVELEGNQIIVSGEKRSEETRKEGHMVITERAFGHFRRILPLSAEVDAARARADYKDGVLAIELPKVATSNRRVVQVS